jgi:alkylated DNA repair dioxygenase AlkB
VSGHPALPDEELGYDPAFLARAEADRILAELLAGLAWEQKEIRIFGSAVPSPRLSAWYGDPGARYTYSGLSLEPLPWVEPLLAVKRRIETATGCAFNSVLANLYRDGADSVGWHSDDERDLGPSPVIASLTLGAERRFLLRPKRAAKGRKPVGLELRHGSLLLMRGGLQRAWKHSVPKTRRAVGPRVNLTYRRIVSAQPV